MSISSLIVPGPLHAVAAVLLALCLLKGRKRAPPPWLTRAVLVWAAWLWLTATPALGNLGVRYLENRVPPVTLDTLRPDPTAHIVVLASGQLTRPDGTPSPVLDSDGWERLQAGIGLWRRVGGRLVLPGGPGHGVDDALAQVMRRAALEAGVPASAIVAVGGSFNTFEDLSAATLVMAGTQGPRWLVTSAVHMPRASAVALRLGWTPAAFPCAYRQLPGPTWRAWLPDNESPRLWRSALHELLGMAVYRYRGWV